MQPSSATAHTALSARWKTSSETWATSSGFAWRRRRRRGRRRFRVGGFMLRFHVEVRVEVSC